MAKRKPQDPRRTADLPHHILQRTVEWVGGRAFRDPFPLGEWQSRRAVLKGPGRYEMLDSDWQLFRVGDTWGGPDQTLFMRHTLEIPSSHDGRDLYLDIFLDGGEAQVSVNGRPWQGLDWERRLVPLVNPGTAGRRYDLEIEAFIINYPYDDWRGDERDQHRFEHARLVARDAELEAFFYDARWALDFYVHLWEQDADMELEAYILDALDAACGMVDIYETDISVTREQVGRARRHLRERLYSGNVFRKPGRLSLCGQSHLDVIYLWPVKETLRKNCRTNTNMLSLMREYPRFLFSQSQPYLYEDLKTRYPDVFKEVAARIREGRWEAIGAMYVEPDANLLGPESLVRQVLFGKRFLRREFGVETETCWMPDMFGAVHTLPQILLKSGIKYFTTIKLTTWNDTNDFPHHTFWWEGPDGSRVLTHFPPTHFGEMFEPGILRRHWEDYAQKQETGESLLMYGWADGGGGPTREMVEYALRAGDFVGMPQTKIEFAEEYFRRIEKKARDLPVWNDELYVETHRGTYTTRGDLKKRNREAERLYRDAEVVSSIATLFGGDCCRERLNQGWKHVLVNQFHDTLPGTHVAACLPDIDRDYEKAFAIGHDVLDNALSFFTRRMQAPRANSRRMLIFNTLSWKREPLVALPEGTTGTVRQGDDILETQQVGPRMLCRLPAVPPLGWTTVEVSGEPRPEAVQTGSFDGTVLETPFYKAALTEDGVLGRLFDREAEREVLDGAGNRFQVFEDNPGRKLNAWDIHPLYEKRSWPVSFNSTWRLVENGPLICVIRGSWTVLNSKIRQDIVFYRHSRRIDFRTEVDWQDSQRLLKVAFPLAVRTRAVTCDMPFGNIERPTHRNTDWDAAKFEIFTHKWADMSEGDYGVTFLNDGKYGCDARDNVFRQTLIKAPVRPNPKSDIGLHRFTYAIRPHRGSWREGDADRAGYAFNAPVRLAPSLGESTDSDRLPAQASFAQLHDPNLIVETIKQAEDDDTLVMRLFDNRGTRGNASLQLLRPCSEARETNLMEEPLPDASPSRGEMLAVAYSPYEIKTLKIRFPAETGS